MLARIVQEDAPQVSDTVMDTVELDHLGQSQELDFMQVLTQLAMSSAAMAGLAL